MHELSIASDLLRCALQAAQQEGARRIHHLVVEVGVMRQVAAQALREAFAMLSEGTAAEGAELEIIETDLVAKCRRCGRTYEPDIDDFRCPDCDHADVDIAAGNDIILKSVSCQAGGEADKP